MEIKLKKNVIIILIDGARLDRVEKSKIFNILRSQSNYFKQTILDAMETINLNNNEAIDIESDEKI